MLKTIVPILLFSVTHIYAFQDYDIDGVENSIDRCPNTSFDAIVDAYGCSENQKKTYKGKITLQIGAQITQDSVYDSSNSLNLYANYRYMNWDISLSNLRTTTNNTYVKDNFNSDNDIYLSSGYFFMLPTGHIKLSIGTRFLNDSDNETSKKHRRGRNSGTRFNNVTTTNTLDNDYFASINLMHRLNLKQNIFIYTAYTLTADNDIQNYEDYASFSIGTGYAMSSTWYSALSYNYTGSIYTDTEAEKSISLFNSYSFTQNLFATVTYSYALDDLSYDHTLLFALGVIF